MNYLLHGWNGMGWVDRVPRAGNLNIGGLYALYQSDIVKKAGITHVLSIIDYDIHAEEQLRGLKHLHIVLDDMPNENIIQHFEKSNAFIDEGLKGDGGVFVHCAMGKSRSATLVCAYLMWKYGVGPEKALEQVCEGRPVCGPNVGFMEQLEVYEQMLKGRSEGEREKILKRWEHGRFRGEVWEWDARKAKDVKVKL